MSKPVWLTINIIRADHQLPRAPTQNPAIWFTGLLAPFCAMPLFLWIFRHSLLKITAVMFTRTEFRVKTKNGWTVYDRTLTHRFVVMEHDKARREREEHALRARRAQMNGRVESCKRYYSDSWHIVFE